MKLLIHLISIIEKIVLLPLRLLALTNSAMRRLEYPPKKHRDLVIDIGGGGLPNPFAHVVVEGYPQDTERATKLRLDRNLVWAYADKLPFKDKVFSFSTMSHVLEHLYDPENSLKEIERISKAGYIETPNSFYETAVPHVYHVSRCDVIDNKLVVRPKKNGMNIL